MSFEEGETALLALSRCIDFPRYEGEALIVGDGQAFPTTERHLV